MLLPLLLVYGVSFVSPVFIERYLTVYALSLPILVALAIDRRIRRAHAAILLEHVRPEPRHAGQFEGKIRFKRCFEILLLVLIEQRAEQIRHLGCRERRPIQRPDFAIHTQHRRQAGRQMQVGRATAYACRQQFSDIHRAFHFQ